MMGDKWVVFGISVFVSVVFYFGMVGLIKSKLDEGIFFSALLGFIIFPSIVFSLFKHEEDVSL